MKRLLKKCRVILIFYIFLNYGNYTYAQVSVQQFWLLNQSPDELIWDNTGWNNQIDNGSGTFSTSSLQWTGNGGKTNTKWNACKNAMFGGNLGVGTAGIVTLGTPITNMKSISFRPATSGNFTIIGQSITTACANDLPINVDSGLSPTIQSVLTGSNSITKTGTGSLILAGTNTYTGTTNVKEGTLQIGAGTAAGTIAGSVPVNVSSGATFFWNNPANMTFSNKLSGTGTARFQGNSSSSAKRVSQFYLTGDNTGFSGNIKIHTASFWAVNLQSQFGSATITIEKGACARLQTVEFNNSFILEDQSGYWDTNPTINVAGALWFSSGASLSGNLILNNTTNVIMGDATAQNSALLNWDGGNTTISGVISGPGNLAMSCNSGGWTNGGVPPPSNISLTGTLSNTYLGTTVVNGQQRTASLLLRKTGGAVAIPANGTVWMGNNTGGNSLNQPGFGAEANLRMGDDQSTGSTTGVARNQWDNQFGSGVVMQFNNTGGNYMRFDLQGTNQTLAGLNAGSTATPAAAIIQNQNINAFSPNNPATLMLNGSGNYLYNGFIRDQDNNQNINKLNLIWNGTGSQTIAGSYIFHTGTTTVNNGSLICYNTTAFNSDTTINSGGILEMNVPSGSITGGYTISGGGSLVKSGAGIQILSGNNTTYSGNITINGGTLTAGNIKAFGTGEITVNAGATLNKNGFAIANAIVNNGGTVLP